MRTRKTHRNLAVHAIHAACAALLSLSPAAHGDGFAPMGPLVPAGPPAHDDCSTPLAISGSGVFTFDTTSATTGNEGQDDAPCTPGSIGIENDVWYCWTATCNGVVTINTCGQTPLDTKISLYDGCGCPLTPTINRICCNDDFCGTQSSISCDVQCDRPYMIQIGSAPGGLGGGAGTFTIDCAGEPCDSPAHECTVVSGSCCAGRPQFEDPNYTLAGTVAVVTASPAIIGGNVLEVVDLANLPGTPSATNFPAATYADPTWSAQLGSVFGLCLDTDGNIYTTAGRNYVLDVLGSAATNNSWGNVYRIHGVTGAVSIFATLPQGTDPSQGPGLGNISYDCQNDQFFVTNMEDGKIYRLDQSGAILSSFDHGVPDDGLDGYAPLGDRPWGVEAHGDRVYYGVWWEDESNASSGIDNEVWSVALSGGDFTGAAQMEIVLPPALQIFGPQIYSMPVADIRFTPEGDMLLAEHGMLGDTTPNPHQSRVLKYECVMGTWTPSADIFTIGVSHPEGNATGGVDIDYAPGGRVWATGDAISFGGAGGYIYGLQGLPASGGDVTNSHKIDYNGDTSTFDDKNKIGDVVVSCTGPCMSIDNVHIECEFDATGLTGKYIVSFDVTNNSGIDAQYILLPDAQTVPHIIPLSSVLSGNGGTTSITIGLCDAIGGETVCFDVVLADDTVDECCRDEICVQVPECDCLIASDVNVVCNPDGSGTVLLTLDLTNLTPDVIEHLFLFPPLNSGIMLDPEYIDIAPLSPFATTSIGPIKITGAPAGEELCIRVSMHTETFAECCSELVCFTVPACTSPSEPCDLNHDGVVDALEILALIAAWGPCPNCPEDLNGDGVVDALDWLLVIASWTTP